MLVIILLSGIGVIALNAATFDVASAGAIRMSTDATSVAEAGLVTGRYELGQGIDGVVMAMQYQRENDGRSPAFQMDETMLEAGIDPESDLFWQVLDENARDSFGRVPGDDGAHATKVAINVVIDRPREAATVEGFQMRESVGADSATFCFRNYRMTSTGIFMPAGVARANGTQAGERIFITTGPVECTN